MFNLLFLFLLHAHPLHVTVTEVEYDKNEKELEIMIRVFSDDLEQGIRREQAKSNLDIFNPPGSMTTTLLVETYIMKRFEVSLDGKLVETKFLGFEREGEALICYVQVSKVRSWKTIEVSNSILTEMFNNQSNLVHVTVDGKVKSMRLGYQQTKDSLTF